MSESTGRFYVLPLVAHHVAKAKNTMWKLWGSVNSIAVFLLILRITFDFFEMPELHTSESRRHFCCSYYPLKIDLFLEIFSSGGTITALGEKHASVNSFTTGDLNWLYHVSPLYIVTSSLILLPC